MNHAPRQARLLWDHSGLWGLMTLESCRVLGLPLTPITAAQVAAGGLTGARLLVVPGGWPSLKSQALGQRGSDAVRRFVQDGGRYLGFCGGAGLTLSDDGCLGLLPLGRDRGQGRLPSASGPLLTRPGLTAHGHPLWRGLGDQAMFHVWFPGQFGPLDGQDVEVLAVYHSPAPLLHCADVQVGLLDQRQLAQREREYGLRLDPSVLIGRPAVVGSRFGAGQVIASYPHLDTTGDAAGGLAMANLWSIWAGLEPLSARPAPSADPANPAAKTLAAEAWRVWGMGVELGLWRPRHPVMPLWRRGARGLEFWTLTRLCAFIAGQGRPWPDSQTCQDALTEALAPVWRDAPAVLRAQAALVSGGQPDATEAELHGAWFPAPRRVGGDFGRALEILELAALDLAMIDS